MFGWKRWTTVAATSGALLLGGFTVATTQEAQAPELDVDELATRLELDQQARAELEQLRELLGQRSRLHQEMTGIRSEMAEVMQGLHDRLSAEQLRGLGRAMREAGGMMGGGMHGGAMMGKGMHRGGMMGGGMHGGAMMGQGMHRGGMMGSGMHGGAMMGQGMHRGGMMGSGMHGGAMMGPGAGAMGASCPWATAGESPQDTAR